MHPTVRIALTLPLLALLAGCEIPGLSGDQMNEADAKATGSACRHALRGIEDCYLLNPKAPRAAVYAGWKEMDGYMRENKLEGMVPAAIKPATAKGEEIVEDDEPPKKAKKKSAS